MESYLRIGLLAVAGVILVFILFEAWNRRRCMKLIDMTQSPPQSFKNENPKIQLQEPQLPNPPKKKSQDDLSNSMLMMTILAKGDNQFSSYDLLQSILATGLTFGDGNLFHYSVQGDSTKLFSLAAATHSGEFDLQNIGSFSCKGLILFADVTKLVNPAKAFEIMHATALLLTDDLDGILCADPQTPWSEEILDQYWQKIHNVNVHAIA